jgi:CMP-N-acetylneuraminic acid synthetase
MPTAAKQPESAAASERGAVEKTTELSEQVLEQVKESQESAIAAVRRFMESVDEALPLHGESPSRRQEVIDSALEMSQKLVKTQYDFLTSVVRSAGEALGASGKKK